MRRSRNMDDRTPVSPELENEVRTFDREGRQPGRRRPQAQRNESQPARAGLRLATCWLVVGYPPPPTGVTAEPRTRRAHIGHHHYPDAGTKREDASIGFRFALICSRIF